MSNHTNWNLGPGGVIWIEVVGTGSDRRTGEPVPIPAQQVIGQMDEGYDANAVACVNSLAGRDPAMLGELEAAIEQVTASDEPTRNEIANLKYALAAFRTPVEKAKEAQ